LPDFGSFSRSVIVPYLRPCYNSVTANREKKNLLMYIGRKPRRRSPRRILFLLILIAGASLFVYYIWTYQPGWSKPFEPTPTPTRTLQSFALEAEAFYTQGQLDEAIAAYEQAVTIKPDNTAARIRLVHLLVMRERTAEALNQAQQALLLEPSNPQALAALCQASDGEGQYADAFDACECAIELGPDYAEAYAYLAKVYVDTGDWIPARQYAQQAVDMNYQSMDAHYNQGYVLEAQGRYRQAVEAYENAIVLQPKLAPLYISAGQNHRVLGQFPEAIDRFEKAIRIDPANPAGYDQLGWTYYTSGQYSRAIDTLEEATLIDPNYTTAWGHLGIVYYVLQQYEEVIPALQQAISLAEKDYLHRARRVVIIGQDTSREPAQPLELMSGSFPPPGGEDTEVLSASLSPIPGQERIIPKPEQTCGDLIAYKLSSQTALVGEGASPNSDRGEDNVNADEVPTPVAPFLDAQGMVTLDLNTGQLNMELAGIPQPEGIPYEAKLLMWPDSEISLGYFQPDARGDATLDFTFKEVRSAPVDYYTLLGFSYVFLDQCDKGVPWLLNSLDIDPSSTNPAWQGLAECPENPPADEVQPSEGQ
jgi:tetratricopeptide (TPR) repeat protein